MKDSHLRRKKNENKKEKESSNGTTKKKQNKALQILLSSLYALSHAQCLLLLLIYSTIPHNHNSFRIFCSCLSLHKVSNQWTQVVREADGISSVSQYVWWELHPIRRRRCIFVKNKHNHSDGRIGSSRPVVPLVQTEASRIHTLLVLLSREKSCRPEGLVDLLGFWTSMLPHRRTYHTLWTPALSSVSSWATFNHFFFVLVTVPKENYCTFSLFWMDEAVSFRVIGVCIPCQLVISHIKKVLKLITQKAAITFCRHHMYKSTGTSDQIASYYFDTSLPWIKQQKYFFFLKISTCKAQAALQVPAAFIIAVKQVGSKQPAVLAHIWQVCSTLVRKKIIGFKSYIMWMWAKSLKWNS